MRSVREEVAKDERRAKRRSLEELKIGRSGRISRRSALVDKSKIGTHCQASEDDKPTLVSRSDQLLLRFGSRWAGEFLLQSLSRSLKGGPLLPSGVTFFKIQVDSGSFSHCCRPVAAPTVSHTSCPPRRLA